MEEVTVETETCAKFKVKKSWKFLFASYIEGTALNYGLNCSSQSIDYCEISPWPKQYNDKKFPKVAGVQIKSSIRGDHDFIPSIWYLAMTFPWWKFSEKII